VAKNGRNHSKTLPIPGQPSRRLKWFPDRQQPLMVLNSGASRQSSKHPRTSLTSTGDMSVESESYFMLGSRDLEKRIRFESACRSLMPTDTFFALTSRA
jgi:hypothetical protein